MDKVDANRLASLKRDLEQNEQALASAIWPLHAQRLASAINSQKVAIARLESLK